MEKTSKAQMKYLRVGWWNYYDLALVVMIKAIGLPIEVQFKDSETKELYYYYFPFDLESLEETIERVCREKDVRAVANEWIIRKEGKTKDITLIVNTRK